MIFSTWLYGFFLAGTLAVYWTLPARVRPLWLIAAGLAFYAQYFPPHLPLIVGLTVVVYGIARAAVATASAPRRRTLSAAGIAGAIAVLAYYKYSGWIVQTLASAGVVVPENVVALVPDRAPLAISFFVFEYVHYLVEVRRGTVAPGRLRDFSLFILFFPTLVCGPIKRFDAFGEQLAHPTAPPHADVAAALERIVWGLAKKILVADPIGRVLDVVWLAPLTWSRPTLWVAMYAYAIQILFDFSGYTDIAIGSARLFGFRIPENFDYPYFQTNLIRFWRSWHISLTSWIADYVYVPLGGNRRGALRTHANRLVAMALCGLWHGAAGHFVWWGVYHGIGLNLCHLLRPGRRTPPRFGAAGRALATVATFHYVCFGWLLFRLDTVTAVAVFGRLVGWP